MVAPAEGHLHCTPMTSTSPSIDQLVQPHIQGMRGYTPGEQVNQCLKLNTNECAWPPSPSVFAGLAAFVADGLRLYPDPQSARLREAAGKLWNFPAAGILAGNGSDDCLTILYRCLLQPGDRVAVPWPTYGLYDTLAAIQNVEMVHVPWGPDWSLPGEALLASGARMLLIANPNNPSASLISSAELCALAKRFNGLLVVDEAYIDYAPEGSSCIPQLAAHPNMVVLRTCSKSYSLAGARLGFCLGQASLISQMMKVKDSYNVNALTQAVGLAALGDRAYHQRLVADTLAARETLEEGLRKLGWALVPSSGNFVLAAAGPRAGEWYAGLKQRGILVRWWDTPELREYLRITVGQPADQQRLLAALRELGA
ncbi:MAG: histidinol-phosphate transaminase [Planctomycetota bacterium]|nr:MAG: histidinol-phosphate transaminase [Planctomycetota bacterium]